MFKTKKRKKRKIMKIIFRKKYGKENLKIENQINPSLPRKYTEEEVKKDKLSVYVNQDWKYVIEKETVDFVFLNVASQKVYGEDEGQIKDILILIELWTNGELLTIELPQKEFYNEKWLKDVKTSALLQISKTGYQKLIGVIKLEEKEQFYFDKIGIHKLGEKYYYATSNCTITADGINKSIKALQDGFDLECGRNETEKEGSQAESIQTFMKYSKWNYKVFYSLHCISIIAILRYFLKGYGISAGAVLWIDGKVASGKTQLAITMGDFFNRDGGLSKQIKHLHTTKAKTKVITEELIKYKNAVLILDDIKKEETVRNRENAKNITDLLIRSIYTGKIGEAGIEEEEIEATAIITGEFFKEIDSTISRVLYLNIDNFLQEKENSVQFREIQTDKYYLAKFMSYFIQWLLKKMEMGEGQEFFSKIYMNLQQEVSQSFHGELNTRIVETVTNFQLVSEILNIYFEENGVFSKDRVAFWEDSKKALKDLGEATLNKCLGYNPFIEICFIEILPELKIKDCRYGEHYLHSVAHGMEYAIENNLFTKYNDETGISDNEEVHGAKKVWLLGLQDGYDGIMFNIKGNEMLLVKTEVICNLIREKMKESMQRWHIRIYNSELTDERILSALLERQCLYGYRRKDGAFSKIVNFPEYIAKEDGVGKNIIRSEEHSMVKINIDSKIKYKGLKNLNKLSLESLKGLFEDLELNKQVRGRHNSETSDKEIQDAITECNRFLDLK